MFFVLSKILNFLINPLSWIAAGLVLSLFSKQEKIRKISLIGTFLLFVFFTNPLIINIVLQKWEYPPVRTHELPLVRTGVMLGGVMGMDKTPEDQLHLNNSADRLTESIRLLQEQVIRELIISGGSASLINDDEKESTTLISYLRTWNLSGEVIEESQSRNTHENAVEVARILEQKDIKDRPILLITSAFHMPRAIRCFEKQGIQVIPYPVDYEAEKLDWDLSWFLPSASALDQWARLIKEWVGLVAYRIMGYA